jgi:hypothetical protein
MMCRTRFRFLKTCGQSGQRSRQSIEGSRPRFAARGTLSTALWEQGKAGAAVEVEPLWDESTDVDILCGYVMNSFQHEKKSHIYERICAKLSPFLPYDQATFRVRLSQPHVWNRVQNAKAR